MTIAITRLKVKETLYSKRFYYFLRFNDCEYSRIWYKRKKLHLPQIIIIIIFKNNKNRQKHASISSRSSYRSPLRISISWSLQDISSCIVSSFTNLSFPDGQKEKKKKGKRDQLLSLSSLQPSAKDQSVEWTTEQLIRNIENYSAECNNGPNNGERSDVHLLTFCPPVSF